MKARPILFNDAMVRALRDGRKTQHRTPVTLREFQPSRTRGCDFTFRRRDGVWEDVRLEDMLNPPRRGFPGAAAWAPGDRLWVRECYASCDASEPPVVYRADGAIPPGFGCPGCRGAQKWRPSIHMPRWASRLTLEVLEVRVERLHEITEDGAKAEGAALMDFDGGPWWSCVGASRPDLCMRTARGSFANLWGSIYGFERERGDYGWAANPLVWVCTFKVVPP